MLPSLVWLKYLEVICYLKDVENLSVALSKLLYYFYLAGFFDDGKNSVDTGLLGSEAEKVESGKFTSKELDEETGLYYFGARYLDPQTSRWMSADIALATYLPTAGGDKNKLPGQGGVYNPINLNLYNYSGNNPLSYKDPDGKIPIPIYAILLDKLFGKSGRQNKTNAPINGSLIKQEDYPSQLGIYCGKVSEYNGAQIIGLIHNKSNQRNCRYTS